MYTIGVFSYIAENWKAKGYPLDLWIEYATGSFDQVSLFYMGDWENSPDKFDMDYPNLKFWWMPESGVLDYAESRGESWEVACLSLAESLLQTQWSLFLRPDEFLLTSSIPDLNGQSSAFRAEFHQLAGDLTHEIRNSSVNDVHRKIQSRSNIGIRRIPILAKKDTRKCTDGFTGCLVSPSATLTVYSTSLLREVRLALTDEFELVAIENPSSLPGILQENADRFRTGME